MLKSIKTKKVPFHYIEDFEKTVGRKFKSGSRDEISKMSHSSQVVKDLEIFFDSKLSKVN